MKRAIPWVVAVVALIAFGASFSELQRMRGRFGDVSRHNFHDHRDVREFMIRAALAQTDQPIIVIGDSITEMARFPENLVNAGIGGATIEDFETLAPRLFEHVAPSVIVVALGTNNDTVANYARLLSILKKLSPRVLAVAIPTRNDPRNEQIKAAAIREGVAFIDPVMPADSYLPDGIHLNAAGYRVWTPAIVAAASGAGS